MGRGANARGVQFTATAVRRGAAPTQCTLAPPAAVRTASALRAAVLLAVKRSCGGAPWGAALVTPLPLVEQRDATSAEEAASSRPLGPAVLPPDEARHLISTPAQRATVAAWACLEVALLLRAATAPGAAAAAAAAPGATAMALFALVAAAWLAADLAVGLFHFFVDNYGDEHTPVIGHVIAAFQGHHTQPWLITRGQFCTVVEGPCMTQLPLQLAVLACGAGPAGCVFMAAYAAWSVTAQLAHAWSHERRTHLPAAVRVLQDMGILVSCKVRSTFHCACASMPAHGACR